ncbi:hypothetical protein DFQ28_009627 [Apophysomyces sp. BC1034]|nr:hypothetical protein DFQ30_004289 [Apophysomyces sp. BC1015]KAG0172555.1 hypothetical protein DFQ29_008325 [Apophysomyces sp. BC1021]KAG0185263.1 hypothetical protein DFQ28_009627 [Apophysomyces sp. BC1034]
MAQILDIILEDTYLDLKDGETMSRTSKEICKANAKTFDANFMMNGRRIDLIIQSKDLELSTNEWKKEANMGVSLKQQAKNIRMNKALLSKRLTCPVAAEMIPRLSTQAMDWIGIAVSQDEDVFVARLFANLELPTYVANIPDFMDTLDALYVWKNHHCAMKGILLPAIAKKDSRSVLANLVSVDLPPPSDAEPKQVQMLIPQPHMKVKTIRMMKVKMTFSLYIYKVSHSLYITIETYK